MVPTVRPSLAWGSTWPLCCVLADLRRSLPQGWKNPKKTIIVCTIIDVHALSIPTTLNITKCGMPCVNVSLVCHSFSIFSTSRLVSHPVSQSDLVTPNSQSITLSSPQTSNPSISYLSPLQSVCQSFMKSNYDRYTVIHLSSHPPSQLISKLSNHSHSRSVSQLIT